MRFFKCVSFFVVGLLVTVLFGCVVSMPTAAQGDMMQFNKNKSAASTYYYSTAYDGNNTYAGTKSSLVSVNVVSKASVAGAPAVCAQGSNGIDAFVQGTDHALWHAHYQSGSGWSAWQSLGGYLTSDPAATSSATGYIDVSVRGSDGALWYKDWNGAAWSSWHSLGGQIADGTGPAACP